VEPGAGTDLATRLLGVFAGAGAEAEVFSLSIRILASARRLSTEGAVLGLETRGILLNIIQKDIIILYK
jgi:hypothetical protein